MVAEATDTACDDVAFVVADVALRAGAAAVWDLQPRRLTCMHTGPFVGARRWPRRGQTQLADLDTFAVEALAWASGCLELLPGLCCYCWPRFRSPRMNSKRA